MTTGPRYGGAGYRYCNHTLDQFRRDEKDAVCHGSKQPALF